MTPQQQAKSDASALLGGLTYMLRRLSVRRKTPLLDRIDFDDCVALARWMEHFDIEPEKVEVYDFRERSWYHFANGTAPGEKELK